MIFNNNIAGKLMTMAATKNHIWKNGGCLTILFYVTLQCKLQYIRQQCCQHKTFNDKDKKRRPRVNHS